MTATDPPARKWWHDLNPLRVFAFVVLMLFILAVTTTVFAAVIASKKPPERREAPRVTKPTPRWFR